MNHFRQIAEKLNEYVLDGMLLTGEANRFYASGFHSIATDGVALVTRGKSYYFTDSRYIEAANRYVQGAEIRMVSRGHGYAMQIDEVVREHKLHRLGFEDATMTVADWRAYRKAISCELVPATDLLLELRRVKDDEELTNMISAQRITEKALDEILNEIRTGVTEKELAARLQYLVLHYGAENMSFDAIVLSGANSSLPHGVPSDKKIESGDFVTLDFGCIYHGYCSDMTRTVAVGFATEEMQLVYNTVLAAQKAGIAAARAGTTGQEIDAAARKVIAAAGYGEYFGHSFGHGVGVEVHEAPNASPSNEKPLPAGTIISAEPGIYLPGKMGVRIEDVILLREDGCCDITKAGRKLLIL